MTAEEIRLAILEDKHLGMLSEYVFHSWLSTADEVEKELQLYWSFRDEISIPDGITMKGRRVIVPVLPQRKLLKQLHINQMGIKKTKLLTHEYIYWLNVNADIEDRDTKIFLHYLQGPL